MTSSVLGGGGEDEGKGGTLAVTIYILARTRTWGERDRGARKVVGAGGAGGARGAGGAEHRRG